MKQKKQKNGLKSSKEKLLKTQRIFASIIRKPLLKGEKMAKDSRCDLIIEPSKNLTSHKRLELYAQQYWWRIQNAFDEDFTCLQLVLSKKSYFKVRDSYLKEFLSNSYTLRDLGKRFETFLKTRQPLPKKLNVLAIDCARYDWQRVESYDALESPPLTKEIIQSRKFEEKKLYLQPHVSLLDLEFPVHYLVRHSKQKNVTQITSSTSLKIVRHSKSNKIFRLNSKRTFLVLYRYNFRVCVQEISEIESKLILKLRRGATLGSLYRVIQKDLKNVEHQNLFDDLQNTFARWFSLGWLSVNGK